MALDIAKLGARYGPETTVIDAEQARAYAAATNDDIPAHRSGPLVPPVFAVVPTWPAIMGPVRDLVPDDDLPTLLHLSHDMHFHRPLRAGETLVTDTEVRHIRGRRSGAQLTLLVTSRDTGSAVVLEQFATMFIRGMAGGESGGEEPPGHALPGAGRSARAGERVTHVDPDQTFRYRDASGDTNPIHVDDAFAKEAGLPGIILHGLCTMAMCSQAVTAEVAGGDSALIRRLAVRFSRPVVPGTDLVTTLYDLGESGGTRCYGFEAHSQGQLVVKNGRAEVGPAEA